MAYQLSWFIQYQRRAGVILFNQLLGKKKVHFYTKCISANANVIAEGIQTHRLETINCTSDVCLTMVAVSAGAVEYTDYISKEG